MDVNTRPPVSYRVDLTSIDLHARGLRGCAGSGTPVPCG